MKQKKVEYVKLNKQAVDRYCKELRELLEGCRWKAWPCYMFPPAPPPFFMTPFELHDFELAEDEEKADAAP